jgi:serine/threonine protein phosphatase 1
VARSSIVPVTIRSMGTIAVGDIRGNSAALDDLLGQLRGEVDKGDIVVFLGDYIDRGPNTKECVTAILQFQRDVTAKIVCLCGNHEDWFLRTRGDYRRHSWLLGMEALDTIQSYSPDAARAVRDAASAAGVQLCLSSLALPYDLFFAAVPQAHLRFFENLLPYYQSQDCLCVHGGLDPRIPRLQDQSRETLLWGSGGFPDQYEGAETVVYGHWNNADVDSSGWPQPKIVGRTIGLDTIAHGVLTAMRLPDGRIFQSGRYEVDCWDRGSTAPEVPR